jgi:NADH-quinone oxidoreductase subunit J
MIEVIVFAIAGAVVLAGGLGVVLSRNPVHSALSLVATLFGIAVLFVAQEAHFLAAVQVIVYAGAIVVLFLFVIMLLGVDQAENLTTEPLTGQRPAAAVLGLATLGLTVFAFWQTEPVATGARGAMAAITEGDSNVVQLGRTLFTDHVFAFELTSVLLVIGVVGAIVLARRPAKNELLPEQPEEV